MLELNKIYNMDCLEGMKQLEDNSVDYPSKWKKNTDSRSPFELDSLDTPDFTK